MKPSVRRLIEYQYDRRSFFKALGTTAVGVGAANWLTDEDIEAAPRNVQRNSVPSQLKITDLRVAVITGAPMNVPLIRIDANRGISGYGEVRDGGSKFYALMLKSRILGENPCDVDKIFRKIKQFGHQARQVGGVCGIKMALWDLAGKAYGVPAYQMLGGKFRDKAPLYADTTEGAAGLQGQPGKLPDGILAGQRPKGRMDLGITYLKQDFGIGLLRDIPGALCGAARFWSAQPRIPHDDASVHRHRDHGQRRRDSLEFRRRDSLGDRHGDSACLGPLRPHQRQQLHQAHRAPWRSTIWPG